MSRKATPARSVWTLSALRTASTLRGTHTCSPSSFTAALPLFWSDICVPFRGSIDDSIRRCLDRRQEPTASLSIASNVRTWKCARLKL